MWRDLFDAKILARGFSYFTSGRVDNFKLNNKEITANIIGSKIYNVYINLNEFDQIEECYCDCPHFLEGNYCKHLVASLYKYESYIEKENYIKDDDLYLDVKEEEITPNLNSLIENLERNKLNKFLSEALNSNESLRKKFLLNFDKNFTFPSSSYYKEAIDAIVKENSNYGFIDYMQGMNLVDEISYFLNDSMDDLFLKEEFDLAFEIIYHLIYTVANIEMDGSNGEHAELLAMASFYLEKIVHSSSESIKYFDRIKYLVENKDSLGILDDFFDEILYFFDSKEKSSYKINYYKEIYEKFLKNFDENDIHIKYRMEKSIINLASLYLENNMKDELLDLYNQWSTIKEIRILMAKYYLSKKETDLAIKILIEGEKNTENKFYKIEFSNLIKDIYRISGDNSSLYNKIIEDLYEYKYASLDEYSFIKENSNELIWYKIKDKLLDALDNDSQYTQLLFDEKEFDRLLEIDFNILKYNKPVWKYMKKNYPKIYIEKYENYIYYNFELASNRKQYKKYTRYLKELCCIDGGKEKAKEIIYNLINKYPRRSAMIEELNKVKEKFE